MIQFIEVTKRDGGVVLVGLRYIKQIRAEEDGSAVLFLDGGEANIWCKESYKQVAAALGRGPSADSGLDRTLPPDIPWP